MVLKRRLDFCTTCERNVASNGCRSLHIDECRLPDGPLRVVPMSHKNGRLSNHAALEMRDQIGEVICPVEKGGALVMSPLLLHASSKASGESKRRVLHFVYGPTILSHGLTWRYAI